ncbi:hypothetical protein ACZ90_32890 [Streptomyces albus subsp. albus]|nr:hypothetical protein ACZ90_32890 [Streptomyces albus subsp. albus]
MSSHQRKRRHSGAGRGGPHRVRLPGFISDEEVGLGDVVKRATSNLGIRPCGDCGERARRLNNWMVFSKRR